MELYTVYRDFVQELQNHSEYATRTYLLKYQVTVFQFRV